jgi:MoxR-like ATPase
MPQDRILTLPEVLERLDKLTDAKVDRRRADQPDLRDGSVYRCPPELLMALRVAFTVGRPLLLYGWPGSGKSSIAAYLARNLGWRYYEHVVTARTEASDLLWRFDHVKRLADAQVRKGIHDVDYVEPGSLWWAFNSQSARRRGAGPEDRQPAEQAVEPKHDLNQDRHERCAVVLIDELDKADPDVPSGLLVPLGSLRFTVTETGAEVKADGPADGQEGPRRCVIITTNEERDLPAPFVRRCIVYRLEPVDAPALKEIAHRHLSAEGRTLTAAQSERIGTLAKRLVELRPDKPTPDDHVPSTRSTWMRYAFRSISGITCRTTTGSSSSGWF